MRTADQFHFALRCKLYELQNDDWVDKGTGYCSLDALEVSVAPRHILHRCLQAFLVVLGHELSSLQLLLTSKS